MWKSVGGGVGKYVRLRGEVWGSVGGDVGRCGEVLESVLGCGKC